MAGDLRPGQGIAAVERALDVLNLFAASDQPSLGVTEIAQQLGLSKSVVFRILSSFRNKGFVEIDETNHRYSIGPRVMQLGLAQLDRLDFRQVARDALESLSQKTNETATLSVRVGDHRVYIDQVTPARDVRMVVQLGRPQPLHAGASSKALLAFLSPDEIADYLGRGRLERVTKETIVGVAELRKELDAVRKRGYAMSFGERMEGAGSVAAPVFSLGEEPVAVMSISGPAERFLPGAEKAARLLLEATTALSRQLGHRVSG